MKTSYTPVLQAATGQWMLGRNENHTARPLSRLEIEMVIERLQEQNKTEELWEMLEQMTFALTGNEGEDHAGVVLRNYIAGLHRMLADAIRQLAAKGANPEQLGDINGLRPVPDWGAEPADEADERKSAMAAVHILLKRLKVKRLPSLVIIGLPKNQETIRMSGGLNDEDTRNYFFATVVEYLNFIEANPTERGMAP